MVLQFPKGKYVSVVKVGEKGQIVIPKEARAMFDIRSGDSLLLLADVERGIALVSVDDGSDMGALLERVRGGGFHEDAAN